MKTWKEMTPIERLRCEYSDLHKEVFGHRPDDRVFSWSDDQLEKEFQIALGYLEEEMPPGLKSQWLP
jgi:hypothetical protein